jgi:hypothetical protein
MAGIFCQFFSNGKQNLALIYHLLIKSRCLRPILIFGKRRAVAREFQNGGSIRSGVPKAKLDFSNAPAEELETFLRRLLKSCVSRSGRQRTLRLCG